MNDGAQGKLRDGIGKQGPLAMDKSDASPDALPARQRGNSLDHSQTNTTYFYSKIASISAFSSP